MHRRLLGGVALLALVAVLAAPVAAQAEPHWYIGGIKLVKAKTVKTEGGITIGPVPGTTIMVGCKIRDAERIENPASGGAGVDIMKSFKVLSCGPNPCPVNSAGVQGALKVKALKLPWASKLVEVPPIADEFTGVELELSCKGTGVLAVISGTLSPWVKPGFLEFTSGTGTLSGWNVIGNDAFLPATTEAQNP